MLDLSVDIQTADLELDDAGDLAIATGLDELAQRCRSMLSAQRGFWDFDSSWGLPWREQILGRRRPDTGSIAAVVRAALQGVEGILGVPVCRVSLEARTLRAEVECSTAYGLLTLAEILA